MKRKRKRTKYAADVAILGITITLIIILQLFAALLQKLGMPMSLALGLIPVFVVSQTHGIKHGVICGAFFGLITLVFSAISAAAIPIYTVTINPLVSVFPRIMVGVVCALTFGGLMRVARKRNPSPTVNQNRLRTLGISATATVVGVLTNTILYLGMFFAFAHGKTFDGLVIDMRWILASIVALNTVIELVLFTVAIPPIVYALTQSNLATKLKKHIPAQSEPHDDTDDLTHDYTKDIPCGNVKDIASEDESVIQNSEDMTSSDTE